MPACRWVRLACERNVRDTARSGDAAFGYWFDCDAARRICTAAEQLPHIKGTKAKVVGYDDDGRRIWATIQLEPWQCWLLTTIFGWKRIKDDLRRFRTAFVLVPRKNAKSTLAAAVTLFMLTSDGESGAECYSAATTRDQAKVIAEIVWEMAARSPQFRDFFGVRVGAKTTRIVEVPATASKFMPLSADAHSLDGLNISFAAVDELHAHKTRAVWDVIDTATGARSQPLLFPITTAGVDTGGICYEKLGYLEKVLDGRVSDDTLFGVNYTIDEGDDWREEHSWRKANPNYGVSVEPDDLRRKAKEAEQTQAATNNFLTKHLNVWVRAASTWMSHEAWAACADSTLRSASFAGYPCWIGVDLSEVRDICAIVALFQAGDAWSMIGRFYLPQETIQRSPVAQMSGWVRSGHLISMPGNQIDFQQIENDIMALIDAHNVQNVNFDRALAAMMQQSLKRRLEPRMGRDQAERFVLTVPQNPETLNPAMQTVMQRVLAKTFRHDANPVMGWMVGNVVADMNDRNEMYPRKAGGKDSPNKIDGAMALLTCVSSAMRGAPEPASILSEWVGLNV